MATIRIIVFTFHNVSINTTTGAAQLETMITYLHSTMFLLILVGSFVRRGIAGDLHSTMFLLIQSPVGARKHVQGNLHSTMFLLIQPAVPRIRTTWTYLHSTMFLLILRSVGYAIS